MDTFVPVGVDTWDGVLGVDNVVVLVAEAGATSVSVLAAVSEAEAVRLGGVIVGYGLAE